MLKFEFEECCPYCEHTIVYSIEDIGSHGFITCKNCGRKHLACNVCTCSVDQNGNCAGCGHDKTKWALSIPDTEYVLDELIKSVNNVVLMRVKSMHSAEDKAEKSVEYCMKQIQCYVHEYLRPYISLLCMERENYDLTVDTKALSFTIHISVCRSGDTDLCTWGNTDLQVKIVSNWKSVKESIHHAVQYVVNCKLDALKKREKEAMNTQRIADEFEI